MVLGFGMDLASRIDVLLIDLREAREKLDRAEKSLADGRASITARDARLGGAHELLRAHHRVQEARRLVDEASGALEIEKVSLADRRPAN
jgi:hypothetical protein